MSLPCFHCSPTALSYKLRFCWKHQFPHPLQKGNVNCGIETCAYLCKIHTHNDRHSPWNLRFRFAKEAVLFRAFSHVHSGMSKSDRCKKCVSSLRMETSIPVSSLNEHTAEHFQMRCFFVSLAVFQQFPKTRDCAANLSLEIPREIPLRVLHTHRTLTHGVECTAVWQPISLIAPFTFSSEILFITADIPFLSGMTSSTSCKKYLSVCRNET